MTDIIALNDDQARTILVEALNRGLYESLNNEVPQDSTQRMKDAEDLVKAAKAAFNNGNRSDNVQTILFVAESDQKPLPIKEQQIANSVSNNDTIICDKNDDDESNFHNGIDLATLSDGIIDGLITGLDNYPPSEQVENDRKAYLAEKERRANEKAGKSQDEPQGTTAQEVNEKAGEAAPEGKTASVEGGNQISLEGPSEPGLGRQDANRETEGSNSAQGEDAGAFARAQTPETSPEGKQTKVKKTEEDGSRAELEEKLTFDIVRAHNVDISKLGSIPISQIQFMLENPDGPGDKKVPIRDSEVEDTAITNKEVKAVAGISAQESSPERVISKEDLGIEVDSTPAQKAAEESERESLEAQITGPTLKAFGRGRKEIPSIGINELSFMVEHPDGKVTQEELEAARKLDYGIDENGEYLLITEKDILNVKNEEDDNKKESFLEEKNETLTKILTRNNEDKKEVLIKSPPVEEWSEDKRPKDIDVNGQKVSAEKVIEKENFPIPPNYKDEEAPVFPMDVSLCSRDELFSLHAKFHAYETRMNWILSEKESEMNDYIQLRNYREAVVAKEVPFMGEDGKRHTNEHREAQVRGDKEVLDLGMKEYEIRKVVTDLKVLQKNYHLSCERLSRQMSKYETEIRDAPR